jgi:hypothetical protein
MADQPIEDIDIDAVALQGAHRVAAARKTGTCALWPDDPLAGQEHSLLKRQKSVLTPAMRDSYNMELCRRVLLFLEFWDANVGDTVEFPIAVAGESPEALDMLDDHMEEMRSMVGMLTEL